MTMTMTKNNRYTAVQVEEENNTETWWQSLRETYPNFARSLDANGMALIYASLWNDLAALPGFRDVHDGPIAALVNCGGDGDQWVAVVSGRHEKFDALS